MQNLNIPHTLLKTIEVENKVKVFDAFRNKYVAFTPEEYVRQQLLHFLVSQFEYPHNLIAVEKSLLVNQQVRRYDAVIYSRQNKPLMVIECKAPKVKLDSTVFDQIISYNQCLELEYLLISNGMQHYCVHYTRNEVCKWNFLDKIPLYSELANYM
jgi:hypothetical protein